MKITKRVNFRVEVHPPIFLSEKVERIKQRTEDLLRDIKRHIDFDDVNIKWDTEITCSYCHLSWEEDENGCPVCCNKAIDEWKKSKEGK